MPEIIVVSVTNAKRQVKATIVDSEAVAYPLSEQQWLPQDLTATYSHDEDSGWAVDSVSVAGFMLGQDTGKPPRRTVKLKRSETPLWVQRFVDEHMPDES